MIDRELLRSKASAAFAAIMMMFGLLAVAPPASAVTYSDCQSYSSVVSFTDWYASVYPGTLADARMKVMWTNCVGSDGSSRNNATYAVFRLRCDNPNWIQGMEFDLSNIEGMDLPPKFVPCDGTNWTGETYGLRTPGSTLQPRYWSFKERRKNTNFGDSQFVPEVWENHTGFLWGGRRHYSYSD